jgi:hypothetical protein
MEAGERCPRRVAAILDSPDLAAATRTYGELKSALHGECGDMIPFPRRLYFSSSNCSAPALFDFRRVISTGGIGIVSPYSYRMPIFLRIPIPRIPIADIDFGGDDLAGQFRKSGRWRLGGSRSPFRQASGSLGKIVVLPNCFKQLADLVGQPA